MYSSQHLETLIGCLARLPGIGVKTAQRLGFHLLRVPDENARDLANAILRVRDEVGTCLTCGNVSETQPCYICRDDKRDLSLLCVVEQPGDVVVLERTGAFKGLYHVLRGSLSPLDGAGPEEIGLQALIDRVRKERFQEVVVATNPTPQGEATAHLIRSLLEGHPVQVTRIARGVPMGSDLELFDQATLTRSLEGRKEL
ncbi:MAG: recombination mediator RecR [Candidatus Eisenbacteria bacterium]|uniref:Recombination protein RecR n=1 Tax=Eiseniibacteriota bacterium TaxID=2212470 RepID=A0A948RWR0_UNCEI|nr:recombination mediator RecR [Candidatus Eisenbacteria bacterium]MBU1951030.1 recombination mediator RecR [Candidatus Eisenbacteria bacterium]MBU2689659.1 recombination mediator RecR [Candidatus Eisenbacteria bacterium]